MLGTWQPQLGSPLGYSRFASTCESDYAVAQGTTPTLPDRIRSQCHDSLTTPTGTSAVPTCTGSYTVQANDTCNSIAEANHVSTYYLVHVNNINLCCEDLPAPGSTLCVPDTCDTCDSIISQYNMTLAQLWRFAGSVSTHSSTDPSCSTAGAAPRTPGGLK